MTRARILAAEDEAIVAMDLEARLTALGYEVLGVVATGEEAVEKAVALRPDVVLMDIRLKGSMDGVSAAEAIRRRADVPVVFATAHSDRATLERAKLTEPFGYLVKPYEDRDLETTIEIARYKHAADAKLRRVERWLSATLGSLGDAVLALDPSGHVTYVNAACEALTGWSSAEAIGRPARDVFDVRSRSTGQPLGGLVARVLAEGVVMGLSPDTVLLTRHGDEVEIDESAAPVRDEQGLITGITVCFRRAEARAAASATLREGEAQLGQAQALAAVGRLAGNAAQELTNLLTVITGYSDLAAEATKGGPIAALIEPVVAATQRAVELTNRLLSFDRLADPSPQLLDLDRVVAEVRPALSRFLGERVELRTLSSARPTHVWIDPGQLHQVLLTLVACARDDLPAGGTVTISTAHLGPDDAERPWVELRVVDTGDGLDRAAIGRLFESFGKGRRGGPLGMQAAEGIALRAGGRITVQGHPGQGTTFALYLPFAAEEAPPPAPAEAPAPRGTETIVVVEDDPSIRELVSAVLQGGGYKVVEASGPAELETLANTGRAVDLLLLDVVMPDVSGKELASRWHARCPGTPVLYVSGYSDAHLRRRGALAEGDAFLGKPFTPASLSRKVREVFDRTRVRSGGTGTGPAQAPGRPEAARGE